MRTADRQKLHYADVELDLFSRKVTRAGSELTLSSRETELLAFMMRHPEEVLPRERILRQVWGDEAEDDSNVLNVYINFCQIFGHWCHIHDGLKIIIFVGTDVFLGFENSL